MDKQQIDVDQENFKNQYPLSVFDIDDALSPDKFPASALGDSNFEFSFVVFEGIKKGDLDGDTVKRCWAIDEQIRTVIPENWLYICKEVEGGEWVNLVVRPGIGGFDAVTDSTFHTVAAREIAPAYYQSVHIYMGTLARRQAGGKPDSFSWEVSSVSKSRRL